MSDLSDIRNLPIVTSAFATKIVTTAGPFVVMRMSVAELKQTFVMAFSRASDVRNYIDQLDVVARRTFAGDGEATHTPGPKPDDRLCHRPQAVRHDVEIFDDGDDKTVVLNLVLADESKVACCMSRSNMDEFLSNMLEAYYDAWESAPFQVGP